MAFRRFLMNDLCSSTGNVFLVLAIRLIFTPHGFPFVVQNVYKSWVIVSRHEIGIELLMSM